MSGRVKAPISGSRSNGKQTVVPSHSKDLKTGTVEAIKKQLGIKGER